MTFSYLGRQPRAVAAIALLIGATALPLFPSPASAQSTPTTLRGQVTHVEDGDTLTITIGSDRYPVRLADIDAPETCHVRRDLACRKAGQPLGEEARRTLSEMALGKQVVARCRGASFNRTVCYVEAQGTDLSTALARLGLAWWEPRYGKSAAVRAASDKARAARMGVWASDKHVAPWIWRSQCWQGGSCSNAAAAAPTISALPDMRPTGKAIGEYCKPFCMWMTPQSNAEKAPLLSKSRVRAALHA